MHFRRKISTNGQKEAAARPSKGGGSGSRRAAVQGAVAASGLGAVVFSLASKDLAEEVLGGFAIQGHGHVIEGDEVQFGDGSAGVVKRLGWISTEIRGYDDLVVHVPNSLLLHQTVTKITGADRSRVKQTLRFKYSDLKKVPAILEDIKRETEAACPELIRDGTAIYRAVMTSYEPDHVEAAVDFHFAIPAQTEASARNRQQVLLAIARAVEKNGVEFALPSVRYLP